MFRPAPFFLLLVFAPFAATANPYDAVAQSLEIAGVELTEAQRDTITEQFSASAPKDQQDWHDLSVPLLDDMAKLSQSATRPSTRIRLQDLHRQLIERLVPGDNLARDLLDAQDPMIQTVEQGVGMTERDMGWSIMLEGLKADMPDHPSDLDVSPERAETFLAGINTKFETSNPGSQHFLARVDSWGIGTIAAWDQLTPEERKIAVSVVTEPDIPPAPVLEKVIGTSNVLYWAAGVEIGLTEDEKAAFPELADYLAKGNLAGGMLEIIASVMDASLAAATIQKGIFDFMYDYNMELILD